MRALLCPQEGIDTMSTENFWKYFFEIYETLPRQGPGTQESTARALGLLPPLTPGQRILDIGCGSGAQTIDLAQACPAQIVATDNHPPFVAQLKKRADELGLGDRITAQVADMNELPFPDGSFDLIWSEGAIFIIGFSKGLSDWRRLLKPGGHLVVSEFCWFRDDPPDELREILIDGCPEAGDVEARLNAVEPSGYELIKDFKLPAAGWWENFYVPLAASLKRFCAAHAGEPEALAVAEQCQQEIDMYQKYPDAYGYVFFLMKRK
jgi:ubiquinone/menaquinone biosynthesis C-methylase UbiE